MLGTGDKAHPAGASEWHAVFAARHDHVVRPGVDGATIPYETFGALTPSRL